MGQSQEINWLPTLKEWNEKGLEQFKRIAEEGEKDLDPHHTKQATLDSSH